MRQMVAYLQEIKNNQEWNSCKAFQEKVVAVDFLRDVCWQGFFFFLQTKLWCFTNLNGRIKETVAYERLSHLEVGINWYIVRRRARDLHAKSVADMYLELITPVLLFLFQKRKFHITALIAEHFTALTSRGKEGRKVYCNQNCFCSTRSLHKIK